MDRRWKPTIESAPDCPRCNSSNTKFCYYNNYSLTQPRYFCKSCRRYWTKGGSLRNVPVGGGCRKNRRGKSVRVTGSLSSSCSVPDSDRSTCDALASWGQSEQENHIEDNNCSTIDLALVYAKFLNQENQFQINQDPSLMEHEFPNQFDFPYDLSNTQNQFLNQNTMVQCGEYSGFDPKFENYIASDEGYHVRVGELEANRNQENQQRIQQQQSSMNSDFINLAFQATPKDGVLQDIFMSSLQLPQQPLLEPADNPPLYPKFSDLFSPI